MERIPRLAREEKTVRAMIGIYCREQHRSGKTLCDECREVYEYASFRILKCPHMEEKPSCAKCEIHCFQALMKEKIKTVMRYAGPRMMLYHPLLTVLHYLDSLKSGALRKSSRPRVKIKNESP